MRTGHQSYLHWPLDAPLRAVQRLPPAVTLAGCASPCRLATRCRRPPLSALRRSREGKEEEEAGIERGSREGKEEGEGAGEEGDIEEALEADTERLKEKRKKRGLKGGDSMGIFTPGWYYQPGLKITVGIINRD